MALFDRTHRLREPRWFCIRSICFTLLIALMMTAFATAEDASSQYFSLDREDRNTMPGNLRFLTEGEYELTTSSGFGRHRSAPAYNPSTEGMDTLNISGSQQYSETQFKNLAAKIEEFAEQKDIDTVVIVDLRQEFHAYLTAGEIEEPSEQGAAEASFANGSAVSLTDRHNAPNKNKGLDSGPDLIVAEFKRFANQLAERMEVRLGWGGRIPPSGGSPGSAPPSGGFPGGGSPGSGGSWPDAGTTPAVAFKLADFRTERQLANNAGFTYLRIAATDRLWPQPTCIDEFIAFAKDLDMGKSWLHFHCLAGYGRTATFMAIYDMMKNPDVGLSDIVYRQSMTGGENLLNSTSPLDGGKSKAEMVRLIYQYIQENRDTNYATPWSEWLAGYNAEEENFKMTLRLFPGDRVAIPGAAKVSSSNATAVSVEDGVLTANREGDSNVYVMEDGVIVEAYHVEVLRSNLRVVLPDSLNNIGGYAFSGDSHILAVKIGGSVQRVGDGAFSGTGDLAITVESDGTEFDVSAFDDKDKPVFLCKEGSKAAKFATEAGYPCFYLVDK